MYIPFFGSAARRHPSHPEASALTGIAGSTPLYTETGPVPAMVLTPGDRVIRRGKGTVSVRCVEVTAFSGPMVRIEPGTLGRARPEEFLLLPPDQRLLLRIASGAPRDGLVAVRDLVDGDRIRWHQPDAPVPLAHLSFGSTEIVYAGGLELEVTA